MCWVLVCSRFVVIMWLMLCELLVIRVIWFCSEKRLLGVVLLLVWDIVCFLCCVEYRLWLW